MRIRILTGGYLLCLILFVLSPVLLQPWLFLYGGGSRLMDRPARAGMAVTIRFIHSVQKTPGWEYLSVNDQADGFCLHKTKYQSFGVGLPFMESDGTFRHEGDYFIMDHMERHFPQLHLRTGVGTQLTVTMDDTTCPVYQYLPDGSAVDIRVAPLYQYMRDMVR